MKIVISLGVAALVASSVIVAGFVLLVALNGFSGRAATPALVTYAVFGLVATGLGGGLPWLPLRSKLASTGLAVSAGLVAIVLGFFAAIVVAEASHKRPQSIQAPANTDE
ncbi:MAG: hypothetical protein U0183_23995 [Polyangiaceae bacterium]